MVCSVTVRTQQFYVRFWFPKNFSEKRKKSERRKDGKEAKMTEPTTHIELIVKCNNG